MTKRFEAFSEEYEALCRKHGVYLTAWYDGEIALKDLDLSGTEITWLLDIVDKTEDDDDQTI